MFKVQGCFDIPAPSECLRMLLVIALIARKVLMAAISTIMTIVLLLFPISFVTTITISTGVKPLSRICAARPAESEEAAETPEQEDEEETNTTRLRV